ncbi:protease inhibitor I42 family protein, partial [bacterium]|nr:protease inhibitor I42 family protein [bacterium]
GYKWSVENFKSSILEELSSSYQSDHTGPGPVPIGGGGTRIFQFMAKREGSTGLVITYNRPWAETVKPSKTFSVKLNVKKSQSAGGGVKTPESVQELGSGQSKSGPEVPTKTTLKKLKGLLAELNGSELAATSAVEFRVGGQKEYVELLILRNDSQRPRCPHEKLPMNNKALKNTVNKLLSFYGKKAENKELAFLVGGFSPPGFCQVTMLGTGLGLYFNIKTGEPMGKLTGKI